MHPEQGYAWPPLAALRRALGTETPGSPRQLVDQALAVSSRGALNAAREILETAIRVRCRDPRLDQLPMAVRAMLDGYGEAAPDELLCQLTALNDAIAVLDDDTWTDVTHYVLGPYDELNRAEDPEE